ncbi:voltage-dependent anion-selective channel protein 3-like [Moschus berezovskii]|uniref:voltage-dependent anion-selective channel protein 3-like n=1 Tax=Moschus berezovskii TaxID=68408 RepID=UPI002443EFC6|nr:voltage-dependent anion-selective channel protein 3-like [Moschus berezovskii]
MCNTPTHCDLGKAAKDVFNKAYGFGMVKIDLRTKSCSGVEFSTSGHTYTDTGKASGNLETKYKICNYGLTFTQKRNTDNTLGTEISRENKLTEGLKLTLDTIFVPNTGNDGTEFGRSIYQKVNEKIEMSINLAWTASSNNTRFGTAAKYKLDCRTSFCAKVNNASLIGLGYTQTFRPGVKLTLSTLIDGKKFSAGGHKFGLRFELEA